MKNLKKLIALIAVLALTLSTVALGATYTDVAEDSAYSVAVESLSKLGIVEGYEDGTYGPEQAVTRAEMATLIARIQGYGETAAANTATVFTDVPADYWASGYIALASNMGIVNGYGDGNFGPDDSVLFEQAVTMIMRTLGYEPYASTNGGYPTGYLAAAQRYGVTRGVSNAVSGTEANRGTIAQLLYNGIDTPIMGQSKWGTNGEIEYTIYDGTGDLDYRTLMSENLGVVKIRGVVTSSDVASLNGSVDIDTSRDARATIKILDTYDSNNSDFASYKGYTLRELESLDLSKTFLVGDSDISDMLGRRVILYVVADEVTDDYVIVSCTKDTTANQELSFTVAQYDGLDTANNRTRLEYYKNASDRDTTSATLEDDAVVVYNNVGAYSIDSIFGNAGLLAVKTISGQITLIDNDSTNGYDVVFVECGASGVVDEVTETRISFKDSIILPNGGTISRLEMDPEDETTVVKLTKDGVEITPADLVEWDVVTVVAANKSSNYITAEVISTPITGVINSRAASDTSDGGYEFRIDGTGYDVAPNAYQATNLQIGDGGIFYIDKYGKIVAFDEDPTVVGGSAGTYAYVIETGSNTSFNTEYAQMRLLTASGVAIFDVADEIELDGADKDVDTEKLISDYIKPLEGQMIKYSADSSGTIDRIDTAGGEGDDSEFSIARDRSTNDSDIDSDWDADNLTLGGFDIDEDAAVFMLARNTDGKISNSESIVGTIADLEDGENYKFIGYLDKKGDNCNIVLITAGFSNVGASSSVAVITDVAEGTNEDLEDVLILSYYQDGELLENVYTSESVYDSKTTDTLTVGDIVKVKVSSGGVITALKTLINFDDPVRNKRTGEISEPNAINSRTDSNNDDEYSNIDDEYWAYGYVMTYKSNTRTITVDGSDDTFNLSKADNIYVIDASLKSDVVDLGAASDIEFDDELKGEFDKYAPYVFARKYNGSVVDVVIIKNIADYDVEEILQDAIDAVKPGYENAKKAYDTAKETYDTAAAAYEATKNLVNAQALLDAAEDLLAKAETYLTEAEKYEKVDKSANVTTAAKTAVDDAEKAVTDAQEDVDTEKEANLNALKEAVATAKAAVQTAIDDYEAAVEAYNAAKDNQGLLTAAQTAAKAITTAATDYEEAVAAVKAVDSKYTSEDANVAAAKDDAAKAEANADVTLNDADITVPAWTFKADTATEEPTDPEA